jgi:hypothetical protein
MKRDIIKGLLGLLIVCAITVCILQMFDMCVTYKVISAPKNPNDLFIPFMIGWLTCGIGNIIFDIFGRIK